MKTLEEFPSTFSIVAYDKDHKEWGVAVQSRFLACGAIVPWAGAGVGAVATQARANFTYGPSGLKLLTNGMSADEVVEALISRDSEHHLRQLAVVDASGNAAAYTGESCLFWAGHQVGPAVSCQGNILAGPAVVQEMMQGFLAADGDLAERLVLALEAAEGAGGDRRGRQSAGILVVRAGAGFGGLSDRYIDLRIDDHLAPIAELRRLLSLHRVTFPDAHEGRMVRLDDTVFNSVTDWLGLLGVQVDAEAPRDKVLDLIGQWDEIGEIPFGWIPGSLLSRLRAKVQPFMLSKLEQQEHQLRVRHQSGQR